MVSTSVSGIGFAGPILALAALLTPASVSPAVPDATAVVTAIDLSISGLRSRKGQVLICLTAEPRHFPDCSKDGTARRIAVDAATAGRVAIDGVAPGIYALSLIHDENRNGRMDMALFLPKEGFGFSRNPAIGMGPPKFGKAKFAVGAVPVSQPVEMHYMF